MASREKEVNHMSGEEIKVVIAGMSPLIRLGLVHTLYKEQGFSVFREIDGLSDLTRKLTGDEADIAVIENSFAMWEVVDLLKKLTVICNVPILVVSERSDRSYVGSVLSAGAAGIYMMSEPADLLACAIRKVLSGGTYLSASLSRENGGTFADDEPGGQFGIERLSERELRVFELMGMGYDTKEIGEQLHVGSKTVETHRRHIRLKLDSKNTSALLRRAISWVVQTQRQPACS